MDSATYKRIQKAKRDKSTWRVGRPRGCELAGTIYKEDKIIILDFYAFEKESGDEVWSVSIEGVKALQVAQNMYLEGSDVKDEDNLLEYS